MTLRQQTHTYLASLLSAGYKDKTRQNYRAVLLAFVAWCETQGVQEATALSPALLKGYQQHLATFCKADGQKYTPPVQRKRFSTLQVLFRWLSKHQHIAPTLAQQLALPRRHTPTATDNLAHVATSPTINGPLPHAVTLRQHVLMYLDSLGTQNHTERTHEAYRERLLPFVAWSEERGVYHAVQVSLTVLEGYQRYLRSYCKANGQHYSLSGQLIRLSALRMLFRWLLKRHHILYNPAELLELPKEEKRLPRQVFSTTETENVMQSLDINTPLGLRNRAILEVLWSSGIRRMELANLMLADIDIGRGLMAVRQGKGHKDRMVPIGEGALEWVARYLDSVRPRLAYQYDSGHLFISIKGSGLKRGTLTMIGGQAIREKARLDKPGACHVFRHSMATQMLENGADTRHIQEILGHEKLETTQIYTRVAIGHLKAVHSKTHPAEKKRQRKTRASDSVELADNLEPDDNTESPESPERR